MSRIPTFELDVHFGEARTPAHVRIAIQNHDTDPNGRHMIPPECFTLDDIEGHINTLQFELDELRAQARRLFNRVI